MHEMSIAQSVLDIVQEEMKRHGVNKVEAINIAVGALSAVVPSALSFCWEVLADGTDFQDTKLKIRVVPLTYQCHDCGKIFTCEDMCFSCPECQADNPSLTAGRDMTVESIEVAN